MHFEADHLYHLYNRGNNSQKIFYNRENYLFFLKKIKLYVLPYADILAWVLMPNHFHIMVYVKAVSVNVEPEVFNTERLTLSEPLSIKNLQPKVRTFNNALGIMLRTYARAIQKQEKMTGSLFQEHTKASCLTKPDVKDFNWYYEDYELQNNYVLNQLDYPTVCFGYIHENPVKSALCPSNVDWEFSSAPDYFANRKGKLINKAKAK
ncbi:MAG TPA: hypothetical protein VFG54_01295, partial [Prolixibacteraceae bacterium]|nr:hypothetical protein [Prolixibacteraceae bacterium]